MSTVFNIGIKINRSFEYDDSESRNKLSHTNDFYQGWQEIQWIKKKFFQQTLQGQRYSNAKLES